MRKSVSIAVLLIAIQAATVFGQDAKAESALTAHLASIELFQRTIQEGGFSTLDAVAASGSVLTEASLTAKVSSNGGNYSFPLEFGLPPLKSTNTPTVLQLSELKIGYSPVTVVQATTAGVSALTRTVGQALSVSYKLPLYKGPTMSARAMSQMLMAAAPSAAAPQATLFSAFSETSSIDPAVAAIAFARLSPAVREWSDSLWQNFKLTQDTTYKANWAEGKQDEFALSLAAEKGFKLSMTRSAKFGAQAGWSHFRSEGVLDSFSAVNVGGNAAVGLGTGTGLSFKLTAAHYDGDGFTGISGVADPTKRTDIVATEAVTFSIAGGQLLTFGIRQAHLGTGNVSLGLVTDFGFVFKR